MPAKMPPVEDAFVRVASRAPVRGTARATARAVFLGGALMLAGCAAQMPEARVTRFHLGQPIAPGHVAVEPRNPTLAGDLEFQSYARAVQVELDRLGFTIAPNLAKSEIVAVTEVQRSWRPSGQSRGSSISIGLGGASGGGGWRGGGTSVGLGGSFSFPVGKQRERMDVLTELSVQLKRRSEGTVIWEGRAESVTRDGTPQASPQAAVQKLATALFRDFPGVSGQTITVK